MTRLAGVWLVAAACGCSKSEADAPAKDASPSSASASASAAPAVAASTAARPLPPPAFWSGTYKSVATTLYIPPDWKAVHWKVDETGAGLGEGTLTLRVDPEGGRVHGTVTGPLGPATVDGLTSDGGLTARIARTDPHDQGFAGTLEGSVGGATCEGTMHVSLGEAGAIRTATFTLASSGSGGSGSVSDAAP